MLKMNFLKIFPSNIAYSDCIMLAYHSHLFLQIYYLKYSPVYTIPSIHTFYYHFISQSIWFCHSLCVLIFCFLHFFMYSLMLFFPWNILRNIREISKGTFDNVCGGALHWCIDRDTFGCFTAHTIRRVNIW